MRRELVWIDHTRFRGWGCSQCAWVFNPPRALKGDNFEEMKQNFESQRDQEFASHVCTEHPRKPKPTSDAT
jgi:hypothetical protein